MSIEGVVLSQRWKLKGLEPGFLSLKKTSVRSWPTSPVSPLPPPPPVLLPRVVVVRHGTLLPTGEQSDSGSALETGSVHTLCHRAASFIFPCPVFSLSLSSGPQTFRSPHTLVWRRVIPLLTDSRTLKTFNSTRIQHASHISYYIYITRNMKCFWNLTSFSKCTATYNVPLYP